MSARLWEDTFLDRMRCEGDPVADEAVAALATAGRAAGVGDLVRAISRNEGILGYSPPPAADARKIARGGELFQILGPEILTILGFYALPASYAARKGVQVLYRTAALTRRPVPRLAATARFVAGVMARGGLAPGGRGVRSVQRVRLMHAAVRHVLTHDRARPWDASLGVPSNQEDMAGTLMTFGYIVLDGLARLGVELPREDREAWLHVWQVVGGLLGVRAELIPADVAEARELTAVIHRRQIAPSPEGRALTAALVDGFQGLLPAPLKEMPASLIHFFLDRDPFDGRNIAEMLGVPRAPFRGRAARLAMRAHLFCARRSLAAGRR